MAELKRVHVFAGREALSDMAVRSIEGSKVTFEDGSSCDLETGGMSQLSSGNILVRRLHPERVDVAICVSDAVVQGSLIISADPSGVSVTATGPVAVSTKRSTSLSKPREVPWYIRLIRWLRRRW